MSTSMPVLLRKWAIESQNPRRVARSVPTSVRLAPDVDVLIQDLRLDYPHLTQTRIINDLLRDALQRLEVKS